MERRDMMCENREIYSVLDEFFHHYFVERDAEKTLSCFPTIFTALVQEKERSRLKRRLSASCFTMRSPCSPDRCTIHHQLQRETPDENCWDCFCNLEMQVKAPNGVEALYFLRVTAGLHKENDTITIDTLHASESSSYRKRANICP